MKVLLAAVFVIFTAGAASDAAFAQPAPGTPMSPPSKPPQTPPKRLDRARHISCNKMMAEMGPGSTRAEKRRLAALRRNCMRG